MLSRFTAPRVVGYLLALVAGLAAIPAASAQQAKLELQPGDHICIIGNTLADRMQHDGWLETYLHTRFPKHDFVVRNLGFSADELNTRLRSMSFGSPDEWLKGESPIPQPKKVNPNAPVLQNRFEKTNTKADVIFAFFGYNESYAGDAGLAKFKQDYDNVVKNMLKQKYNGKSAPRIVLFSPTAFENHHDRNLPSGVQQNKNLAKYAEATAEVAKANNLPFVDLFGPTKQLFDKSERNFTLNGIHMTEQGNEEVAKIIDQALFGPAANLDRNTERMDKIRQAVKDRNERWYLRYRTTDGYSVYGDRAFLRFVGGQTNYEVGQKELEQLDVQTSNRDKRVWALAQGSDIKVDDSNLPEPVNVTTNKPGSLPGGKHLFLDGEEAIKKMTVAKGLKVNLFASEKEFPELVNPVQMSFDTKGRLWVAVWPTYPHAKPTEPLNDKILIFEDTDGDGKADKVTTFAGDLHNPTGFEFYKDGIIVAQAPDIFWLRDTNGDDKYDVKVRLLTGIDSADTHHTSNSFVLDPGGALYFQEGTFHHSQIETPYGPPTRLVNAGVFRYEPRTQKIETYVAHGFANPHGHVFDRWGRDIIVDGTGANPFHGSLFSSQVDYPNRNGRPPQVYKQKTRPCPGMEFLSSKHFPESMDGSLLVPNVIGFLGILQYKVSDKGASITAQEAEPLLSSTDPNFRPSDLRTGPDGALYFIDWHNPIIGHMQHNLRDPSRDREHGRIYRVTAEGRPLSKSPKIAGESLDKLLDVLKHPEDRVRYRARIELGNRDSQQVVTALRKWVDTLDRKDAEYEHHLLEAVWMHQYHNVVDEALLKRVLRSPEPHARAAATRVLGYSRDLVKNPIDLLRAQVNDEHPAVRMEAVRALSFFRTESALATAVEVLAHPTDEYINFVFNETLNTLERRVGGGKIDRKNIAASLLNMLSKDKIAPERKATLLETIVRNGGEKELGAVWNMVVSSDLSPSVRKQTIAGLIEAAQTRKTQPKIEAAGLRKFLEGTKDEARADAIALIAAWKVNEAGADLRAIAADDNADPSSRFAAIDALAVLGDAENLKAIRQLAETGPAAVRFRAVVALSQSDVDAAAAAAASALSKADANDDPSGLVEGFLVRKNGSEKLAAAIEKSKVPTDVAKQILRAMFLAGRNDTALAAAASKAAGVGEAVKLPTPDDVKRISAEALAKGDAARGELVFRRADLGCVKCHAVNKAGGNIGPDLGPIGGTSPVDYIVTSILDPNQAIKEEYLTKTIITASGKTLTGIVVESSKNAVVLKEATGKLIRIPVSDIDEEAKGKSLMPEGITRILTQGELLDLVRFVSELGKPGQYEIPKTPTVQRWKRLKHVAGALAESTPNRDILRDAILNTPSEAWDTVFSRVDGSVFVSDLTKPNSKVAYLQGEINVLQAGQVEISVETKGNVPFWVDEEGFEKAGKQVLNLTPGRHRITVRVPLEDAAGAVRVQLGKPADSKATFEPIHGGGE